MISRIRILNFQSHYDSEFTFVKGVNCILGISDTGKSAIIRAIRWLLLSRPLGDSVRSHWGGETSVEIAIDGNVVTRSRDKLDKYQIQAEGEGIQEFKAIGTTVPEEVDRLLNFDITNLQYQLDAPFLLSETPGHVAEFFNKVAKLDKIDTGIANVNSAIRSLEQEIKFKTAEAGKQEEQLKEFDYLPQMEKDVKAAEALDKMFEEMTAERKKLKGLIVGINNISVEINRYSKLLLLEKDVDFIISQHKEKIDKTIEKNSLLKLYNAIKENEAKLNQQGKLLKLEKDVFDILELKKQANTLTEKREALYRLFITVSGYSTQVKRKVSEIASMEAEFEKEMGETCLLCGQPIKKK